MKCKIFSFSERLHDYVVGIYLESSFREFQNPFFLKIETMNFEHSRNSEQQKLNQSSKRDSKKNSLSWSGPRNLEIRDKADGPSFKA